MENVDDHNREQIVASRALGRLRQALKERELMQSGAVTMNEAGFSGSTTAGDERVPDLDTNSADTIEFPVSRYDQVALFLGIRGIRIRGGTVRLRIESPMKAAEAVQLLSDFNFDVTLIPQDPQPANFGQVSDLMA